MGEHDDRRVLVEGVAGRTRAPIVRVEAELRQLALVGLLAGTCESVRTRLRAVITAGRAAELPLARTLPGSRFACQRSGACCRGYIFGPVTAAEKQRIEALDPAAAMPRLAGRALFADSEDGTYRLGMEGDVCVFYEAGLGCGLHRVFGAQAKPQLCRAFPIGAVATLDGLKVYDRGDCATFATSANDGPELTEQLQMAAEEVLYHPAVRIHGGLRCDYGLVLALVDRLDAEVKGRDPFDALQAIGHVTRAWIMVLTRCSVTEGEPEAAAAASLACSAAAVRPREDEIASNSRIGLERLATLADALKYRIDDSDAHAKQLRAAADELAMACAAGGLEPDPGSAEILVWSLRHRLFGRELLLDDSLEAGLLRIALGLALAAAGAWRAAGSARRTVPTPAQLSWAHMIATRTLRRREPHRLLAANGSQVWPILDAMPLLA